MSERILIAGGTGLLGRALARRLATSGREIVLLSRAAAGSARALDLPPGCRVESWDGRTANGWLELASGAEAIVNLAGESIAGGRWSAERKARIVGQPAADDRRRDRGDLAGAPAAAGSGARLCSGLLRRSRR